MLLLFHIFSYAQSPLEIANHDNVSALLNNQLNRSRTNNIQLEERPLLMNFGSFGTSILLSYRAIDAEDTSLESGTFVLAVPLNRNFAVETALVMAEYLFSYDGTVNIIIAFLSDESNSLPESLNGLAHKGFRDLISLSTLPENWVICYFDADFPPANLLISHGIRGYMTPRSILEPLTSLLNINSIPWSFKIWYNEFLYLGLLKGSQAIDLAWQAEINSFVLSAGEYNNSFTGNSSLVSSNDIAGLLLDYASLINFPILITDMHYSILPLPGGRLSFIGEGFIAVFSISVLGTLLVIFLAYTARNNVILVINSHNFLKHFWIFLLLVFLLVFSIRASTFIYSFLFSLFGSTGLDALNTYTNYFGLMLTMVLAVLLYFLPSPLLSLTRFRRRSQFYGFSAVVIIVLGILYTVFNDYSNILIFIWALLFIFIAAISTNPLIIIICISMVPFFAIFILLNIALTGGNELREFFITSNWLSLISWQLAFELTILSLPLFLLSKRAYILFQKSVGTGAEPKPKRKYRLILLPLLIIIVISAMIIHIRLITHTHNNTERRFQEDQTGIVETYIDDTIFQDTRIIKVSVSSRFNPIRYDINLQSLDNPLLPIYSSQVPFSRDNEGYKISFFLGEYPVEPLIFEFAVPINFSAVLSVVAIFNVWNPELDDMAEPETDDYLFFVYGNDNLIIAN